MQYVPVAPQGSPKKEAKEMSIISVLKRKDINYLHVLISIFIVAMFLLNAIPMDLILKKVDHRRGTTSQGEGRSYSSNQPDYTFRDGESQVRICEVMFDPTGEDAGNEWVALYNNGSDLADLSGWRLSNRDGEADAIFPSWSFPADSTLYVHFGLGEDENDFEDYVGHFHTQNPYEIFNNTHDAVALFSGVCGNTTMEDYVAWAASSTGDFAWNAGTWAMDSGIWNSDDTMNVTSFNGGESIGCTGFDQEIGTSSDWEVGGLLINEVMFYGTVDVSGSDLGNEKIEIRNPTDATVSTDGWSLKMEGGASYSLGDFDMEPKSLAVLHFIPSAAARGDTDEPGENDTDFLDASADLYFTVGSEVLGNASGALGLYASYGIVDYLSWGTGGSGSVTSDAVSGGIWSSGVSVAGTFSEGDSLGRDQFSTDTDSVSDWATGGGPFANGPTIGSLNYYNLFIWDADLFADAGEEWIKISNYGTELDVDGWKIYNREGTAVATLPDITLPEESTLTIHFGVGNDELDFTDYEGDWYVSGSGGAQPTSKFFNASLDIILISTGELDGESTVSFEIWLEDGFANRGTRGWFSDAWNAVKSAGKWVAKKVANAVTTVVNGVLKAAKWLREKIARAKDWVLSKINGGLSFNLSLGDYLTLTLTTLAMGWRFHAEANAEFDIPVPGFPIIQLHFAAQGSITIAKGCSGMSASGQIVLTVGVNVGAKIKKLFTLELRAHLRLTITVGNLNIDDYCNPETHEGSVTVGLDIALDIVLGATFKLNTPEFTLFDKDWEWNLAQFTWSQSRSYECCRDPGLKPGPSPEPYPTPDPEPSPPYYYPGSGNYVYTDMHVTNTDTVEHLYQAGGYTSSPDWQLELDSLASALYDPVLPGESRCLSPYLSSESSISIPHSFEPQTGWGGSGSAAPIVRSRGGRGSPTFSGDDVYASPGDVAMFTFSIENLVDSIEMLDVTVWINASENSSLNSSLTLYTPSEAINISVLTENSWDSYMKNDKGAEIHSGMVSWIYQIGNFEGKRFFNAFIEIPEEAEVGSVENLTIDIYSALPNSTSAHMTNLSGRIRIGEKVIETIWTDDLENAQALDSWDNSTGQWEWGERQYDAGPMSDEPGPKIWSTNMSGYAEQYMTSVLESPSVNLSDYGSVSLRFLHWLDMTWGYTVKLYLNSSGTWYPLDDWWGNQRWSSWQEESYDITPFISDRVSVAFYFSRTSSSSYYGWHIDDLAFVGTGMGVEFYEDELENGTTAASWENNTGEWEWGEMGTNVDGPGVGSAYANMWGTALNSTASEGNISILESPVFDLSVYDIVNVRLWHWISADGEVKLYVNDSGVWQLVKDWSGDRTWIDWKYEMIDISDFISDNVRLVFYFNATVQTRSMYYGWYINNFSLATKVVSDVSLIEITPIMDGGIYTPGSQEVTVNVDNLGDMGYTDLSVGLQPVRTGRHSFFYDNFSTDEGWSHSDDGTGAGWYRDDDINFGESGGYSMNIGGATDRPPATRDAVSAAEDILFSPVINLTGVDDPVLAFWENSWFGGDGGYRCELYVSTDGADNWSAYPIWAEGDNSKGLWEHVEISLEDYISSEFCMKFVLVSFGRENSPYMVIDNVWISGREDLKLETISDVIETLGPGETRNVTLEMDLTDEGSYDLLFSVQCNSDEALGDNEMIIPILIDQIEVPTLNAPLNGTELSGKTELELDSSDPDSSRAVFLYRERTEENWTLLGRTETPDSNMIWSIFWDTSEVQNGNYTLKAVIHDVLGGGESVFADVTVSNPEGSIMVNFSHQEMTGMAGTFTFTDTSEVTGNMEIIAHYWDFGDGADTCSESPVHSYQEDGTFVFYHSITSVTGEIYAVQATVIVIGSQKIVEIEVNFTIDPVTEITRLVDVQFNDTTVVPDGLVLTRLWDFGDGNTSTDPTPSHRYSSVGIFDVNLSLSDDRDHTWALVKKIAVINIPPVADFTMNQTFGYIGKNITFTDVSSDLDGNITSIEWDFDAEFDTNGDGDPANDVDAAGKTAIHSFNRSKTYTVILNITDSDGDWEIIPKKIKIYDIDKTNIQILEIREGEVRTLTYTEESGAFVNVTVSGNGTLVAARVDDLSNEVGDDPNGYVRLSFYLMLEFLPKDGLKWSNFTISYAGVATNKTIDYYSSSIYYWDSIGNEWRKAKNTGVDIENQLVWANVSHFTIFAAYATTDTGGDDDDDDAGGEPTEKAWYRSGMGMMIIGIVILLIIVMLGVFLYAKKHRGDEEEDDVDEEKIKEAEDVIKEMREKDDLGDGGTSVKSDEYVCPICREPVGKNSTKCHSCDAEFDEPEKTEEEEPLATFDEVVKEEKVTEGDDEGSPEVPEERDSDSSTDIDEIEVVGPEKTPEPEPLVMDDGSDDLDDIAVIEEKSPEPEPPAFGEGEDDLDGISVMEEETPEPEPPALEEEADDLDEISVMEEESPEPEPPAFGEGEDDLDGISVMEEETLEPEPPAFEEEEDDLDGISVMEEETPEPEPPALEEDADDLDEISVMEEGMPEPEPPAFEEEAEDLDEISIMQEGSPEPKPPAFEEGPEDLDEISKVQEEPLEAPAPISEIEDDEFDDIQIFSDDETPEPLPPVSGEGEIDELDDIQFVPEEPAQPALPVYEGGDDEFDEIAIVPVTEEPEPEPGEKAALPAAHEPMDKEFDDLFDDIQIFTEDAGTDEPADPVGPVDDAPDEDEDYDELDDIQIV